MYLFLAYILPSVLLASWFSGSISGINLGETFSHYYFKYFFCFISLYSPYYTYVIFCSATDFEYSVFACLLCSFRGPVVISLSSNR